MTAEPREGLMRKGEVLVGAGIILILAAMLAIGLHDSRKCKAAGGVWSYTRFPQGLCLDPAVVRQP